MCLTAHTTAKSQNKLMIYMIYETALHSLRHPLYASQTNWPICSVKPPKGTRSQARSSNAEAASPKRSHTWFSDPFQQVPLAPSPFPRICTFFFIYLSAPTSRVSWCPQTRPSPFSSPGPPTRPYVFKAAPPPRLPPTLPCHQPNQTPSSLAPPAHLPPCPPPWPTTPTPPPHPPLVTSQIRPIVRPPPPRLPPTPSSPARTKPIVRFLRKARPPAHPSAQIQKHPCLPFLGGYSQHSQSPNGWNRCPSLLPHCPQIFPRNMPASRKSSGTGKKHSLPEAPPVPSDVAAPFSWGSAARRQPLNNIVVSIFFSILPI